MSRRIDTGVSDDSKDSGTPERHDKPLFLGKKRGEDYLGRLAKYIPAEIVGLYLATSGMVPLGRNREPRYAALWIVFLINCVFVPLYFVFATTRDKRGVLWPQVVLASLAFPVWVFAIGGPFKSFSWYEGWIASITLAFVTVAFGFYEPKPGA